MLKKLLVLFRIAFRVFLFLHIFISSRFHFFMFSFLLIFVSFYFAFLLFSFLQMLSLLIAFVYFIVSGLFVLLPQVLRIWESVFYSDGFFTLHSLSAFIIASLGPEFQPWRGKRFSLTFKTRIQSICFFETFSVRLRTKWLWVRVQLQSLHSVFFIYIISTEFYLNLLNYIDKLLEAKNLITFAHIN